MRDLGFDSPALPAAGAEVRLALPVRDVAATGGHLHPADSTRLFPGRVGAVGYRLVVTDVAGGLIQAMSPCLVWDMQGRPMGPGVDVLGPETTDALIVERGRPVTAAEMYTEAHLDPNLTTAFRVEHMHNLVILGWENSRLALAFVQDPELGCDAADTGLRESAPLARGFTRRPPGAHGRLEHVARLAAQITRLEAILSAESGYRVRFPAQTSGT